MHDHASAWSGAYLLADALRTEDDPVRAFGRYETAIREVVIRSRRRRPAMMKTLIPATSRQVWLTVQSMRLFPRLPPAVQRRLLALQGGAATALEPVERGISSSLGRKP